MAEREDINESLYRRALGDAFDGLPPALRRFHDRPGGATAEGVVCVTRGRGRIRNWIASRMRLPPEGERMAVRLHVVVTGDREQWIREFGTARVVTHQWREAGLLIESIGPLRLGFRVFLEGDALRFNSARAWLHGIPLPI